MVIAADRVISMTELQKLSLRKLRAMRLHEEPLIVRDVKRGRSRFVILDHEAYEKLKNAATRSEVEASGFAEIDFSGRGLLWDRPTMPNARFVEILGEPGDPDHAWAWSRVLERLPSEVVTRAVGLEELRRVVSIATLRSRARRAWEQAVDFWTEEARRCLS